MIKTAAHSSSVSEMEEKKLSLEPLSASLPIAAAFVFFSLSGVRQIRMTRDGSSPAADTENYFYLLSWLHCHMLCFPHTAPCSDRYVCNLRTGCLSVDLFIPYLCMEV